MNSVRLLRVLYLCISIVFYAFLIFFLVTAWFVLAGKELRFLEHIFDTNILFIIVPSDGVPFLIIDIFYLCAIFLIKTIFKNFKNKRLFIPQNKSLFLYLMFVVILIFLSTFTISLHGFVLILLIISLISIILAAFKTYQEKEDLQKDKDLTI